MRFFNVSLIPLNADEEILQQVQENQIYLENIQHLLQGRAISGDRQVFDARSSDERRGRTGKTVRGRYGDERDDMTTVDTEVASTSIAFPGRYDDHREEPYDDDGSPLESR